jgi:hypothetical protein
MTMISTLEREDRGGDRDDNTTDAKHEIRRIQVRGISERRKRHNEMRRVQNSGGVSQYKEDDSNRFFVILVQDIHSTIQN